jgi:hypothetical protein
VPEPRRGESFGDFVSTYMKSGEAQKSFPKQAQRVAVAISIAKRKKLKKKPAKDAA